MEILVQKGVINTAFPAAPQRDSISHSSYSWLLTLSFPFYILHLLMLWDVASSPYSSYNWRDHSEPAFIQFFEYSNFLLVEYKTKFPQLYMGEKKCWTSNILLIHSQQVHSGRTSLDNFS